MFNNWRRLLYLLSSVQQFFKNPFSLHVFNEILLRFLHDLGMKSKSLYQEDIKVLEILFQYQEFIIVQIHHILIQIFHAKILPNFVIKGLNFHSSLFPKHSTFTLNIT